MWDFFRYYIRIWDWRLFLFILLFLGLPNIYQLYRVRLIGNELPDPGSLAIVSQWQFVGLTIEVFQEATILAIFFFLGSQIRSSTAVQLDRAKSVFTFIFLASLIFSAGVFLFRDAFITVIGTPDEIQEQTRSFLGISIFSVPFTMLAAAIIVLFEALGLRGLVFAMAIANVGFRFVTDSLFFGGHTFSLQAGRCRSRLVDVVGEPCTVLGRACAAVSDEERKTGGTPDTSFLRRHARVPARRTGERSG